MKIKIIESCRGSQKGEIYPKSYIEGEVYEVQDKLANIFIEKGWATKTRMFNAKTAPDNKMKGKTDNK